MNHLDNIVISKQDIQQRIAELAKDIDATYGEKNPILLILLKGSIFFASDLSRRMTSEHTLDFMAVGHDQQGMLEIRYHPMSNLSGRYVLVIEDIIDSGLTLHYIVNHLKTTGALDIQVITLLDNPTRRLVHLPITHIGFSIPDVYVVGYGLDIHERYRNLPDIYEYHEEE